MRKITLKQYDDMARKHDFDIIIMSIGEQNGTYDYLLRICSTGSACITSIDDMHLNIADIETYGLTKAVQDELNLCNDLLRTAIDKDEEYDVRLLLKVSPHPTRSILNNAIITHICNNVFVVTDSEATDMMTTLSYGTYAFLFADERWLDDDTANNDTAAAAIKSPSEEKLQQISDLLTEYAQIDGAHHKMWCLDQILRIAQGDNYEKFIKEYETTDSKGDPLPDGYRNEWDCGIAP